MASEKILLGKQQCVTELNSKIANSVAGVLVDYKGITVADDTKLRKELREAGVDYKVVKNTLLHRALDGTGYEALGEHLSNT
ncbi:MAG: 50S ribosomal protein L10, partial [Oscillospiraceae bacterium]